MKGSWEFYPLRTTFLKSAYNYLVFNYKISKGESGQELSRMKKGPKILEIYFQHC